MDERKNERRNERKNEWTNESIFFGSALIFFLWYTIFHFAFTAWMWGIHFLRRKISGVRPGIRSKKKFTGMFRSTSGCDFELWRFASPSQILRGISSHPDSIQLSLWSRFKMSSYVIAGFRTYAILWSVMPWITTVLNSEYVLISKNVTIIPS